MLLLLTALACSPEVAEGACTEFPESASEPPSVVSNEDDCGYWALAVDDQLVVSVYHDDADARCEATLGEGLDLPYDPMFTNLEGDGPKDTFQIVATSAAESTVAITCDDATTWNAHVVVSP